jgi:hypothetical protein
MQLPTERQGCCVNVSLIGTEEVLVRTSCSDALYGDQIPARG